MSLCRPIAAGQGVQEAPLDRISPDEWLAQNAAFCHGTLDYSAGAAAAQEAARLQTRDGAPVMTLERATFGPSGGVIHVRLT